MRRLRNQRWLLPPNSRGVLPETCKVRVWLGGLDVIRSEGKILEPMRNKGDVLPAILGRRGVHVATS